jgi:hypothetical protein
MAIGSASEGVKLKAGVERGRKEKLCLPEGTGIVESVTNEAVSLTDIHGRNRMKRMHKKSDIPFMKAELYLEGFPVIFLFPVEQTPGLFFYFTQLKDKR